MLDTIVESISAVAGKLDSLVESFSAVAGRVDATITHATRLVYSLLSAISSTFYLIVLKYMVCAMRHFVADC